ncbi:Microtubule-nucleating Tub4p (gamma-tubulin) complex component [Puccinia graminis f. sp. tritici]|uniref:Microtubule-nucleating Tub4p (Gamma-tubulin) complex component n=1 Tax=Puccinia graminis f. sp. tritici TaxID=56615 RepID=A0A5B0NAP0_PUCGR|nr:Microtubule-nucleating Tub4p (gamma-tubulin) complex component [Puccinia graminis f. sp. tritici]
MENNKQLKHLKELIRRITNNNQQQQYSVYQQKLNNNNPTTTTTTTNQSLNTIAEQIKQHLQLDPNQPIQAIQHFTSLLTRLSPLSHPKEKTATLKFLLALAPKQQQHQQQQQEPTIIERLPSTETTQAQPSAAQRLKQYRKQHAYPAHLPEHLLLRDMIYLLQGIDGRYIYFKSSNSEDESWEEGGIGFKEPTHHQLITLPQRDLILKLTELGWLYKKIERAIDQPEANIGTVQQAFAFALKEELGTYYRAIAIIQSHLSSDPSTTLSSKALLLHLTPTVLRLRMSAALISATKGIRGGQMISVLHSYTDHGDPVVHLFTSNLLEKVSVPWFKTLVSWMWDGELVDPIEEFFIILNPAFDRKTNNNNHLHNNLDQLDHLHQLPGDGSNVWQKKFSFRKEMIPSFISEGFARKIFSTGKSLNFIRHSCGDYEWHQTRSNIYQASSKASLHYKDITGLQQTIDSTYSIATRQLFNIFFVKLKLLDHFKAVKDYLLLGRGDFISLLIETLGPSLNKPANTLYRHNLTATLESAIRATSDERLLLNRLDVRMLEFSPAESGWDVFMLEYKTEKPLDVVLSASAMEKYMRMFRLLWKMKRLEYSLDRAWKVVILGVNRALKHLHCLRGDFHKARLVISEMIHFIRQLQSYCHLEVIDCGWQEFEKKLTTEGGDLDSLIEGHAAYLDRLVSKGLLLSTRVGKENTCLLLAEACFKVILEFKDSIDNLYAYGLSKSARLATDQQGTKSKRPKYEDSEEEGGGYDSDEERRAGEGDEEEQSSADRSSEIQLESIRIQLSNHSKRFTELVLDLISSLSTQQDSDMKFLAVRLNFSLFYMRTSKSSASSSLAVPPHTSGSKTSANPIPPTSRSSVNYDSRASAPLHVHRPLSYQIPKRTN